MNIPVCDGPFEGCRMIDWLPATDPRFFYVRITAVLRGKPVVYEDMILCEMQADQVVDQLEENGHSDVEIVWGEELKCDQ